MHNLTLFVPIAKIDKAQRMVWGYASTPTLDLDDEIVDIEAIKAALPQYMEWRNIREMHQPSAVGVAKEANVDEKGLYIGAKIVDDEAWKKVEAEVYKGFSIGGRTLVKDGNRIKSLELIEISLVDRPANPDCRIELAKIAEAPLTISENEAKSLRRFFNKLFGKSETPTGEPEYADPGYQKDGKKRYPIDSVEHIRAAWSLIHMPQNRAPYSNDRLQEIEARIIRAWRDKIAAEGPPETKEKINMAGKEKTALARASQHLSKAIACHGKAIDALGQGQLTALGQHLDDMAEHHSLAKAYLAKAATADAGAGGQAIDLTQDFLSEGDVPGYDADQPYQGKAASLVDRLIAAEAAKAAAEAKVELMSQLPLGGPKARLFAIDKVAFPGSGLDQRADALGMLMKGVDLNPADPGQAQQAATQMISNMHDNPRLFAKSITDPSFRGRAVKAS
jgi:hypothetical protein